MEAARLRAEEYAFYGLGRAVPTPWPGQAKASAEREHELGQESEWAGQSGCQHPRAEILFQP